MSHINVEEVRAVAGWHAAKFAQHQRSKRLHLSTDIPPRACVRCEKPIGHAAICPDCETKLQKGNAYAYSVGPTTQANS